MMSQATHDELRQAIEANYLQSISGSSKPTFALENSREAVYLSPRNCCFYPTRTDVLVRYNLPLKQAEADEKHSLITSCRAGVRAHCKCRLDLLVSDKPAAAFLIAGPPAQVEHAIDVLNWLFATPNTGFAVYSGDPALLLILLSQEARHWFSHRYAMFAWKEFAPINLPHPAASGAGDSPEFTPRASRTAINSSLAVPNRTPPTSARGLDPFAAFKTRPRPLETPRAHMSENKEHPPPTVERKQEAYSNSSSSSTPMPSLSLSTQEDSMALSESEPDSDDEDARQHDPFEDAMAESHSPIEESKSNDDGPQGGRRLVHRRKEFELLEDSLSKAEASSKRARRSVEKLPLF